MAYFSKFYNGLRPIIFFCNHQDAPWRLELLECPQGYFVLFVGRR